MKSSECCSWDKNQTMAFTYLQRKRSVLTAWNYSWQMSRLCGISALQFNNSASSHLSTHILHPHNNTSSNTVALKLYPFTLQYKKNQSISVIRRKGLWGRFFPQDKEEQWPLTQADPVEGLPTPACDGDCRPEETFLHTWSPSILRMVCKCH